MSDENTDKIFIEKEGVKYEADPENPEEALKDENDQPILFDKEEEVVETAEEKTAREKKEKEEEDKEPPVRKSAKDQIIKRLQDKRDKKKKEEDEDDDDEFSDKGNESINKKIQKSIKPILDQVRGNSDEKELLDVLSDEEKYPNAKKMEKKIRKYMEHPAYKDVPVAFIYLGLAKQVIDKASDLKKKKDAADTEAAENATGGTSKKPKAIAKIPDVTNMGEEEFGKLLHKVRIGQFGK